MTHFVDSMIDLLECEIKEKRCADSGRPLNEKDIRDRKIELGRYLQAQKEDEELRLTSN